MIFDDIIKRALSVNLFLLSQQEEGLRFFNVKSLTRAEITFYLGVLAITVLAIAYLIWRTVKSNKNFFGKGDIPVETIKLHVKSEKELENEKKYKNEVEAMIKKKQNKRYRTK